MTDRTDGTGTARDALFASFVAANPAFSPVPLWWWSGEPLDPGRLRWQLERYVEGGVFNLVIMNLAPTGPLYGNPADDPPFFSERWWEIFRGVCRDARELGMRLWFYDQIGFSGANIQGQIIGAHPEFAGLTLERVSTVAEGSATIECPSNGIALAASVTALDADDRSVGTPVAVPIVDGRVQWVGAGRTRLSLFYVTPRGFDYASPDACATLLDTIHGEFERRAGEFFGDVIVGSFQDELPTMPRWSARFAETFTAMHGYDIIPWLDALWEDYSGEERRIRRDYHATRAHLAEEAFFKPLFSWHNERGLLCGVDQQGPARAGDPKGSVSIYADYLRTHRWYSAPGSDHHGEAKIHSSLAHLYGRERTWIESFHSSGWGGTLEETFDWLLPWLRAGANLYDPHATYYSTGGGWFEWAPPATDWRQPYWRHYRVFADAVARLCRVLTRGNHRCDIGVLFPTSTIQSGVGLDGATSPDAERAHDLYRKLIGSMVWFNQQTGVLDGLGVDFDVLDDDSLASARIEDGSLRIAEESYRILVLPACTTIERDVARVLVAWLEAGGKVIALDVVPNRLAESDDAPGGLIARLHELLNPVPVEALESGLAVSSRLVNAPVPTLVRKVDDTTIVLVPAAFPGASKVTGWPQASVDFDRDRYPSGFTIQVRDVAGAPEIWDPFSASRRDLDPGAWRPAQDGVEVDLAFVDGPFALLVWGAPADDSPVATLARAGTTVTELDDLWEVDLVPTLDNTYGDFTFPPSAGTIPVQRWSFEHRSEGSDEAWRKIVATFGPRAWWIGPGHPMALVAGAAGTEWTVAEWSLSRGIHKDPLHRGMSLGPSGHVPEEFLHFGKVPAGRAVRMRTTLLVPGETLIEGWLVIGAAATKRVWIDSVEIAVGPDEAARYQTALPVRLLPGSHTLDLLLTTEAEVTLRASFALTTDLAGYRRPERIVADDEPRPDTTLRFVTPLRVDHLVEQAVVQVGVNAPARILVDDAEIGRQGGFLPYGDNVSTHRYDITAHLVPGDHTLSIEVDDLGHRAAVLVDGVVTGHDRFAAIMSGADWTVSRDGVDVPLAIERRPLGDPGLAAWRQRPHPLPGARWLEGPAADNGTVIPLVPAAVSTSAIEWLRCVVPPGATAVDLPIVGSVTASLDGRTLGRIRDANGEPWHLDLPNPVKERRELLLRVETTPGFAGGAILAGPAIFACATGRMELGNWQELGLADFSGVVRYRQSIELPARVEGSRFTLDLGDVRGTVEVLVDGVSVGTRVLAPYRFDLTGVGDTHGGEVVLELVVANTLAPYLDAVSPTPFVFEGQTVSGIFGPVRLIAEAWAQTAIS